MRWGRIAVYGCAIASAAAVAHASQPGQGERAAAAPANPTEPASAVAPDVPGVPLDLHALVVARADEDAPGSDAGALPRPAQAVRVFTSSLDAQGTTLRVYRTQRPVTEIAEELATLGRARGFVVIETGEAETLAFSRGTTLAMVRFVRTDRGTFASIAEMPFAVTTGRGS
jgi:hypothetical protein